MDLVEVPLVNAGVMLPTPIQARRNPKWPKEWERDWDICESSAAAMLRIQSSSVKFPIAKVMGEIAEGVFEESIESSVKLSVKFDAEEPPSNPPKLDQIVAALPVEIVLPGVLTMPKILPIKTILSQQYRHVSLYL